MTRAILGDVLVGIFFSIATCIVSMRLWTRSQLQNLFGPEDWLVVLATISMWAFYITIIVASPVFHLDLRLDELDVYQRVRAYWYILVGEGKYLVGSMLIKIAILLFYRRLADRNGHNVFKYFLYVVLTEVLISKLVLIVAVFNICYPLDALWLRQNPAWAESHTFRCGSFGLNLVNGSTLYAFEDLVIGLLPCLILWNLKMPFRQKIAVWALFTLSFGCSITSFVRTKYCYDAFWGPADWAYNIYAVWIATGVELALGVICSSVPALKPLWTHFQLGKRLSQGGASLASRVRTHCSPKSLAGSSIHNTNTRTVSAMSSRARSTTPKLIRPDLHNHPIFDGSTSFGMLTSSFLTTTATTEALDPFIANARVMASSAKGDITVGEDSSSSNWVELAVSRRPSLMNRMFITVRSSITIEDEEDIPPSVEHSM